jgi:hypothetical protein
VGPSSPGFLWSQNWGDGSTILSRIPPKVTPRGNRSGYRASGWKEEFPCCKTAADLWLAELDWVVRKFHESASESEACPSACVSGGKMPTE